MKMILVRLIKNKFIDEYIKEGGIIKVAPTTGEYLDGGSVEGWLHANNVVCGN